MSERAADEPMRISINGAEYSLEALVSSTGFLTHASYLLRREAIREAENFDITPASFELLRLIRDNPGIRQGHVSLIMLIQESNMANLVKGLCAAGFMTRGDGKKRKTGLWITADGMRKIAEIAEIAKPIEDQHASELTPAEQRMLRRLLAKVYLRGLRSKLSQQEGS